MGKRKTIYGLIDTNIEELHVRERIKEYISNLSKENSSLRTSQNDKVKGGKRKKRTEKWQFINSNEVLT